MNPCSDCGAIVSLLFSFTHPDPVPGWKFCDVHYLQCSSCCRLYIGEYSEGKISGICWTRVPVYKVHQIEGFIGEAYWRFHEDPIAEPEVVYA